MKKLNIPLIPVITGALALIAVAAVLIIVIGAGGDAGLYITEATGSISITNSDNSDVDASSGDALKQGDIITLGEGASCKIMYKSKKNSDDNYIIASSNTQIVVTDKLTGKNSGELYLNRGSLLCNLAGEDKSKLYIRTADSMVYPEGTVSKIAYTTDGFNAYTDVYTFCGNSKIQLYDSQGNTVNDPEFLVEKLAGRVTTNDLGPVFSYLNIEFPLSELTASDLRNLITISSLVEDFPYTGETLKAAYDAAPDKTSDLSSETADPEDSDLIQTAEPIETTAPTDGTDAPAATTGPAITHQTTSAAQTTSSSSQTTQSSQTTASSENTSSQQTTTSVNTNQTFSVTVIIGDEEIIEEVQYGANADKPADPQIEGKKFLGWDKSFENITEDTVITALFEDDDSDAVYHTVTIKIADKSNTIQVKDGDSVPLPATINIDGYKFLGWDTDYTNVRSDLTITAILESNVVSHTVTFVIAGQSYTQTVEDGGTAVPPFMPTTDADGNAFSGWDKSLSNIKQDVTITALFEKSEYTVIFVIDGVSYIQTVLKGASAVPPSVPDTDSQGRSFIGWDKYDYENVMSDMTITAVFI